MVYSSVSIKNIIGRVIRNTRLSDNSYIQDLKEWIPEAMEMLETRHSLSRQCTTIELDFHKAKLPCGLVQLDAVSDPNGRRMLESDAVSVRPTPNREVIDGVFASEVFTKEHKTIEGTTHFWDGTVEAYDRACTNGEVSNHWYQTELGWIQSSLCSGTLTINYLAVPVDEEGFPLVPDNGDYKEALYWYCRSKLIGAGYDDKTIRWQDTITMYETHAARAIENITYASNSRREDMLRKHVSFLQPEDYFAHFDS